MWVADRGFASAANRAYLTRGGGHYIHAEKLRHTNTEAAAALARPGRYHAVADNLRVKEVWVAPGGGDATAARAPSGSWCATTPTPPSATQRSASGSSSTCRSLIDGSDAWTARRRDELVGSLKAKPGLRRYLRRTKTGLLRIDRAAAQREAHYDGKWLLRTSDPTLTPEDLAAAYKQLLAVERGWRDCKSSLGLRPVLPPPRGPYPRPRPTVLAGTAAHPGRRNRHRRHLAQPAPRTRPHAPGHPRHRRRPRRATLRPHRRPEDHPRRPRPARTAQVPRLHTHQRPDRRLTTTR